MSLTTTSNRKGSKMEQILSNSLFPAAGQDQEIEKNDDPLSSQIWRMYTKAKDTLPNGSRLENLTWRMMAMNLNKKNATEDTTPSSPSVNNVSSNPTTPPPADDTTSLLSSSAPPYSMIDFYKDSVDYQYNEKTNVLVYGSARANLDIPTKLTVR